MTEVIVESRPRGGVMLIGMNRPEKRNALSNAMVVRIGALLAEAAVSNEVKCVVLTGTDEAFSAGADLAEMQATGGKAASDPARVNAWHTIETFPKPIIAAVNGFAFGGGNELAMTCDFIVAGRNAKFGQPEVNVGGMPGDGGTQRLPRRIGAPAAAFMLMSGLPMDADAALRTGHVVEVAEVDRTVDRALEIAEIIATRAPLAVQAVKDCIRIAGETAIQTGLAYERAALWRILDTPDITEGRNAFLEKRKPKFSGGW